MIKTPSVIRTGSNCKDRLPNIGAAYNRRNLSVLRTNLGRVAFALLSLAILSFTGEAAFANPKYAAIVVDAQTGRVLHDTNADELRHPASLTKMMTLFMTFDALKAGRLSMDQALPVSSYASSQQPTKLGLRPGQTLRVEHAILSLITRSANDASVVLAEALGGSEDQFATMMTRKARQLGMSRTVFRNANGLPNMQQVTTARDFATLSLALMRNHPEYYGYFARRNFSYGGRALANHNRLMSRYEGMDGIKTGYTVASGFNLAASAVRDGRRVVAVVMGGRTAAARDLQMERLLDNVFEGGNAPLMARATPEQVAPVRTAARPERAKPTPVATTTAAARAPRAPAQGWGIQVGAFASRAAGERAASQALKQAPSLLSGSSRVVSEVQSGSSRMYRSRLMGLTEKNARSACTYLKKAGHRCLTVSPNEKA